MDYQTICEKYMCGYLLFSRRFIIDKFPSQDNFFPRQLFLKGEKLFVSHRLYWVKS